MNCRNNLNINIILEVSSEEEDDNEEEEDVNKEEKKRDDKNEMNIHNEKIKFMQKKMKKK